MDIVSYFLNGKKILCNIYQTDRCTELFNKWHDDAKQNCSVMKNMKGRDRKVKTSQSHFENGQWDTKNIIFNLSKLR